VARGGSHKKKFFLRGKIKFEINFLFSFLKINQTKNHFNHFINFFLYTNLFNNNTQIEEINLK
jgi:hypothetical protein